MHSFNYKKISAFLFFCLLAGSCKKFLKVELDPAKVYTDVVYSSDVTATSAVTGIYYTMISQSNFASGANYSVGMVAALSADELHYYQSDADRVALEKNALQADNYLPDFLWKSMYEVIYSSNAVLEGLAKSTAISDNARNQLTGEARFARAFTYFYLVNLYGGLPLVTSTDYRINANMPKSTVDSIYQTIITDLTEARNLLSSDYPTSERTRPNKATAAAMLARVYLYRKEWAKAEQEASSVIADSKYKLLTNLNSVFLKNSDEAIWQLQVTARNYTTFEGYYFILEGAPANNYPSSVALKDGLYTAFEGVDKRKANWVGTYTDASVTPNADYHYAYKYKVGTNSATNRSEYSMVLRLAEQYLIRAEARARQNKLTGANSAASDIDSIRSRAGLPGTAAVTQPQLLAAVEQERRVELFTEWGHRWFDLKRWEKATQVLSPIKPDWNKEDVLYPLPSAQLLINKAMRPQNEGY